MTSTTVPARRDVDPAYTWNAENVFPSEAAWQAEYERLSAQVSQPHPHQGRLAEGPAVLADALAARDELMRHSFKLLSYVTMAHHVDMADPGASKLYGQAYSLLGQVLAWTASIEPELIAIGEARLKEWIKAEPRLTTYAHYFHNLFRQQAHVRSAEVEELLGLLADPFRGTTTTAGILTDADMKFPAGRSASGAAVEVSQGSFDKILASPDREARRTAWESYNDTHLSFKNTLANNLVTSIKQNVFRMRAQRHSSTLAASLFANNIPPEVFHNLLGVFKKNLPTWHRYWAIRRKALGVDTLRPYDIWAPLTDKPIHVTYPQAVEWVCAGLAPLGAEYVDVARRGMLADRWVDIYPNQGKMSGAFSDGSPGTPPFILMGYDDTIFSVSTLAHELGHSMHSYLTWKTQPYIYSSYSLFVAEVASNFNQALVRAHLLKTNSDPVFQINVIEEAMANFHRYFFIMPTLARFELDVHERIERGQGVTVDDLNARMADLFSEGYGSEMSVERERVGITWAQFGHLYSDYYVYQYATGISAANALSQRLLAGAPNAAQDYLKFLSTGSSLYPLEALKVAGVDLTTPAPVEAAFGVLAGLVDRLEKLVNR